jgi:hypothetical protein
MPNPEERERFVIGAGRGLIDHDVVAGCLADGTAGLVVDVSIDDRGDVVANLRDGDGGPVPNVGAAMCLP